MRFLMLCLFYLVMNITFATNPIAKTFNDTTATFDVIDANRQFDRLNLRLSVQDVNLDTLNAAVTLLTDLVAHANDCVSINEKRLHNLDNQLQQSMPSTKNAPPLADNIKTDADLVYLTRERKKWAGEQAQCRLFSIRANEAIDAYQTAIAKIQHEEALTRGLTLWKVVDTLTENPTNELTVTSTIPALPAEFSSPILWSVIFSLSALIAGLTLFKSYRSQRIRHYLRMKAVHVNHVILLTLCVASGTIIAYLQYLSTRQSDVSSLLIHLTTALFFYLFGLVTLVVLFHVKKIKAFFFWYSLDSHFFRSLMIFLLSFYAFYLTIRMLIPSLTLHDALWQLSESVFLFVVLATAVYFIYYFCHAHRHIAFIKRYQCLIRRVCTLLFIACGAINIMGYHTLSIHLTFAGISTFAIIFATLLIEQVIGKLYTLCAHPGPIHTKIIQLFGYKSGQTLTELIILRATMQVIIFALALYLMSQSWGYATYYVESAYTQFLYGIHFATFTFYPTRIITGIIVFCTLYLLFRGISTTLSRHEQFEDEEETQVAIASILTYIGFAFALICALLVAGFDFTGLAIVAGALSVGIGLGLQSIVNNFVSGIILLIEKPIKPGDRIQVDGVEGIVKKIRVRSTQITTAAREDIIIPNSDLITRRVTNYMYSDTYLSIHCEVSVAYGSNTELVRQLLLGITHAHDEIIKTPRHKPSVLFRSLGENALIFQVWFLIKDGNKKSIVKSDLHFEIERLFREHHITFALPQRDIHIKLSDIEPFISTK